MNKTGPNFINQEQELAIASETDSQEAESRLLPRRGWQDRQAFLKTVIRTKKLLEISEIEDLVKNRSPKI